MNVGSLKAIEGGGCCYSVRTHVLKHQPVTHLQVRQVTLLYDSIEAVACWAPDAARVHDLIWLRFL